MSNTLKSTDFAREIKELVCGVDCLWDNAWLAGGAVTSVFSGRAVNDYDLYFKSFADLEASVHDAYDNGMWCLALTRRAITFKGRGKAHQLMFFRFFKNAGDIFESFDYTACMGAIDGNSNLTLHPRFLADLSARRLSFNPGTDFPLASAVRIAKYQERGFTIARKELLSVAAACAMKGVAGWDDVEDQVGGHYGDLLALNKGKEFTVANVVAAIKDAQDANLDNSAPANAEDAMKRIVEIQERLMK